VQLVADANVLLSAIIGGRAALALRHENVKKRLDLDTLLLACAALPVTVVERTEYQNKLSSRTITTSPTPVSNGTPPPNS
jgi:hypothetical protein